MRIRILYTEASDRLGVPLMNETDGENKGTIDKHYLRIIIEVAVIAISLTLAVMYHQYAGHLNWWEVVGIAVVVILMCLLVTVSAAWFYSQPRDLLNDLRHAIEQYREEGERLHSKIIDDLQRGREER